MMAEFSIGRDYNDTILFLDETRKLNPILPIICMNHSGL